MTPVCVAQVPFTKRKNGLLEKAREPSILCDSEIAVGVSRVSGAARPPKGASRVAPTPAAAVTDAAHD